MYDAEPHPRSGHPYWVVVGSANGSTNLGDESMWEVAVDALRDVNPGVPVVTDGARSWRPSRTGVTVLPNVAWTLRRGYTMLGRGLSRRIPLVESAVSVPGRSTFAARRASASAARPSGPLQQRWAATIRGAEGLIFSGSGAINDDYAHHGVHAWGLLAAWAERAGKPTYMIGQGIGPLDLEVNRRSAARMLRSVDLLTVRDSKSAEVVAQLGVDRPVTVTADWAVAQRPTDAERARADALVAELTRDSEFLAVSLHRRHTTTKSHLRRLEVIFRGIVESAMARGLKVLFVPNMTQEGRYSDDRETADTLMSSWPESLRKEAAVLRERVSPGVARAVLGRSRGLLTTRYHPMVFALSEKIPVAGLSYDEYYDQKLIGASTIFGVSGNVFRLTESGSAPESVLDTLRRQEVPALPADIVSSVKEPLYAALLGREQ